jgi:arabinan endo-1,5-alpha-L-arabinosidase
MVIGQCARLTHVVVLASSLCVLALPGCDQGSAHAPERDARAGLLDGASDASVELQPHIDAAPAVGPELGRPDASSLPCTPMEGAFSKIYDPSVAESEPWYFNDHTIVRGRDGLWHVFAITHADPGNPGDERSFGHATSPTLTARPWTKQAAALVVDESVGEQVLWAPHVIEHEGTYYMFYTSGGAPERFAMRLATSPDLWTWSRVGTLFEDGVDARDPFVTRVGAQWVMYYTATSEPAGGNHVIAYRTSDDLMGPWGERQIAYTDALMGTHGGNTESPQLIQRPEGYYLFLSVRNGYVSTETFFSNDPFHFEPVPLKHEIKAHAAELVEDLDGSWHISHCGWGQGGLYLAPLDWTCGS